jgi:hypothetical protein
MEVVFDISFNTSLKNIISFVFVFFSFIIFFINTRFDNRMSKIDSWLFLTILKIPIPISEVLNGL